MRYLISAARAQPVHALDQVALDLMDTVEIELSTNDTARVLEALLIRLLADEKTGERFNISTPTLVDDAAQPVTKGIARAAPLAGVRPWSAAPARVLTVRGNLAVACHQASSSSSIGTSRSTCR
jgi:hypothetical protein